MTAPGSATSSMYSPSDPSQWIQVSDYSEAPDVPGAAPVASDTDATGGSGAVSTDIGFPARRWNGVGRSPSGTAGTPTVEAGQSNAGLTTAAPEATAAAQDLWSQGPDPWSRFFGGRQPAPRGDSQTRSPATVAAPPAQGARSDQGARQAPSAEQLPATAPGAAAATTQQLQAAAWP